MIIGGTLTAMMAVSWAAGHLAGDIYLSTLPMCRFDQLIALASGVSYTASAHLGAAMGQQRWNERVNKQPQVHSGLIFQAPNCLFRGFA